MTATKSANNSLLVSRTTAQEAFRDALRLYIGRGRRYSVKQASNASGVPDRMIECFMAHPDSTDYRKPDIEEILSLASFLGPDFTSEWLALAHQGAFTLPDEEPHPGNIAADNADDNAEITRRAIDGEFCPVDKRALRPVGVRMMSRGATLVALGVKAA